MSRTDSRATNAARTTGGFLIAVAVIVAVVLVTVRSTDGSDAVVVPTTSPLSPVEITQGDLVKTDKVDGRLRFSDTLVVRHRIAGQPAVTSTSASSNGQGTNGQSANRNAGGQGGPRRVSHRLAADPVTTTTVCATTTTAPPVPSSSVSAPVTTSPCAPSGGGGGTGGGGGGGATRPGGGASRSSGSGAAAVPRISQMVTSIVVQGTLIVSGDALYTIDAQPVVALYGELPAWRTLSTASTDGKDIQQLEQALVALGYDPSGTVAVDNDFDADTEAMVRRWQAGLGSTVTGKVSLGSVVFIRRASNVSAVAKAVGDSVGDADEMLTLAGETQQVVIDVPAGDEQYYVPGLTVRLGTGGTGTIALLRSVARNSSAVVQAVIAPDAQIEGAENGETVVVTVELLIASDVFVVPAQSIVSRLDGSYSLQVVAGDGAMEWVTVAVVGVAGNKVGVRPAGDGTPLLAAGASVLTPSA